MVLNPHASYPHDRSYVLEHVASGRQFQLTSGEELLAWLRARPRSSTTVLDGMTQGQSVMLATNEIMATCALAFCVAALLIWLAPRTARVIDMRKVGH